MTSGGGDVRGTLARSRGFLAADLHSPGVGLSPAASATPEKALAPVLLLTPPPVVWDKDAGHSKDGANRKIHGALRHGIRRVLLVEDDPDAQVIYGTALTRAGYLLSVAWSGDEAFTMARAEVPDLAIVDLDLPILNGWHLIELLRASESTRDIQIVIVSAMSAGAVRERARSLDCAESFQKPLLPEELLTHVARLIGPARREY